MTALVFVWDVSLARLISLPGMQRRQWQCIPIIEGMVGGALVLLAVLLVILPFFVVQFCTVCACVVGIVMLANSIEQLKFLRTAIHPA